MKKIKKLLAMIMAMTMVLGLGLTSFAATSSTITIENAGNGEFKAVQIVEVNPETDTGWEIVTEYQEAFKTAFSENDTQTIIKGMIFSLDSDASEGEEIENFDKKYQAALENIMATIDMDNGTTEAADGKATITVNVPDGSTAGVWAIKGSEEGYSYSPMAAYIDFEGKTSEDINAKKAPEFIEKSSDDEDKVVEIGKEVEYTITSTIPFVPASDENRTYQVADTLTGAAYALEKEGEQAGMLKVHVVVGNDEKDFYVPVADLSTPVTGTVQNFVLDLSEYLDGNLYANQTIIITYTAIVKDMIVGNEAAVGDGENDAQFGSDSDKVVSGSVTLTKTDNDNNKLSGAEFVLVKTLDDDSKVYATATDNGNGDYTLSGWVTAVDDATHLVTTGADGKFTINGLEKDGKYEFKEVKAPDGYSINEDNAEITWNEFNLETDQSATGTASMIDTKLAALPGTGGIGTSIFTFGGCAIMIAAAALYFVNRRKSEEN